MAGVEFVAAAARTTSGNSGVVAGFGDCVSLRAQLDVTAVAGVTPTLDVVLEDTLDGTNFNVVGTFVQKTTTGREVINVTGLFSDRLRARWTIGGTAGQSFTFSLVGYAE